NDALGAGLNQIITAEGLDAVFNAFLNGILEALVFSDSGLFNTDTATGKNNFERELVDLDSDFIPDGWDYTGDGHLDICLHGEINVNERPRNSNCRKSKDVTSSSYYTPICEDLSIAIRDIEEFLKFVQLMMYRNLPLSVSYQF